MLRILPLLLISVTSAKSQDLGNYAQIWKGPVLGDDPHIPGCADEFFNSTSLQWECYRCLDGFCPSIDNTECDQGPDGCRTCNPAGDCYDCFTGYYLDKRVCKLCHSYCATCSSQDNCHSCVNKTLFPRNFDDDPTLCIPCGQGCSICDQASNSFSCRTCEDGFILTRKPGDGSKNVRHYCQKSIWEVADKTLFFTILVLLLISLVIVICWCRMGFKQLRHSNEQSEDEREEKLSVASGTVRNSESSSVKTLKA